MTFITQKHLSRRALLRSAGASIALPLLDAMQPAMARASGTKTPVRLICMEMVHGAAGSSQIGVQKNLWSPAKTGRGFELSPASSLSPLAPFRDALTIVSNTEVANAEPFTAREIGGDHVRSSAVFLTQAHPKQALDAAVEAGPSLDQLYAQSVGSQTALPSLQLCIEPVDSGGGCGYGYSCVYTDSISWASATQPLPMIRDPRVVFDELFGVYGAGASPAARRQSRAHNLSILDGVMESIRRLNTQLGAADRMKLASYTDQVREVERRIQGVEARNGIGEPREIPDAPRGIPDSFSQHTRLMFDLQLVAFTADITRVIAFKLGRDNSNRSYPESGFNGAFHATSHHGGLESRIMDFERINRYHIAQVAYFLKLLAETRDIDGNSLLHNSLVLYGSPMGDSNLHNHTNVPFFLVGNAGGALKGGTHIRAAAETPLANAMLSVLRLLGLNRMNEFGDSSGALDLNVG